VLLTQTSSTPDPTLYEHIQCKRGAANVFTVRGDGTVHTARDANVDGNIKSGGWVLSENMRANVTSIVSSASNTSTLHFLQATGANLSQAILLTSASPAANVENFFHMQCRNGSPTAVAFSVRGDGTVRSAGDVIANANIRTENWIYGNIVRANTAMAVVSDSNITLQYLNSGNANLETTILLIESNPLANAALYDHIVCRVGPSVSDNKFRVAAGGNVYGGVYHTGGADYTEYFEYEDGNPRNEDRRGRTVTMGNAGMITMSSSSTDPYDVFGVISATPGIVGDMAEGNWIRKYKTDKFGNIIKKKGQPVLNESFDSNVAYVSREHRPEWGMVGLVGKLRVLEDQVVNPSWHYMRTIPAKDGNVIEYLLSSGTGSNVRVKIQSLEAKIQEMEHVTADLNKIKTYLKL